MTYKEHIYEVCENTDLDNKEDVVETMRYLASELLRSNTLAIDLDNKLKETMTAKDYLEWSDKEAKKLFKEDIDRMDDSDFKSFCIDNFDEITGGKI